MYKFLITCITFFFVHLTTYKNYLLVLSIIIFILYIHISVKKISKYKMHFYYFHALFQSVNKFFSYNWFYCKFYLRLYVVILLNMCFYVVLIIVFVYITFASAVNLSDENEIYVRSRIKKKHYVKLYLVL